MVEKVDLFVQSGMDQRRNILIGHCSNAHTTERYFGRIKVAMCNFDLVHLVSFILKSVLNDLNADSNAQPIYFSKSRPLIVAGRLNKTLCVESRIETRYCRPSVQSLAAIPQRGRGEGWIFKCLGPI